MKLIDKDALVAEIDRQKIGYNTDGKHSVEYDTTRKILNIIDTLEVKDVDLDKEIDNIWNPRFKLGWDEKPFIYVNHEGFTIIAKHFFELGLKTQKGE